MPGRKGLSVSERLWQYIDVRGVDECWLWTGGRNRQGYGQFAMPTGRSGGRLVTAHRLAYEQFWRTELVGIACHTCNKKSCCNPCMSTTAPSHPTPRTLLGLAITSSCAPNILTPGESGMVWPASTSRRSATSGRAMLLEASPSRSWPTSTESTSPKSAPSSGAKRGHTSPKTVIG